MQSGTHDLAGFHQFGHRLKNLAIHNDSRGMHWSDEEAKLKEVLSSYYSRGLKQELRSLIFSAKSTLNVGDPNTQFLELPNSFNIINNVLAQDLMPENVVLPAMYTEPYDTVGDALKIPFGAIIQTSAVNPRDKSRQQTTFYLRPGTLKRVFNQATKSHDSKVSHLLLFGSQKHAQDSRNTSKIRKWMEGRTFQTLKSLEIHAFDTRHLVPHRLPISIEELSFVDVINAFPVGSWYQEDIMLRFIQHKAQHTSTHKPVLKKFVHRHTVRWSNGACTIAGGYLSSLLQRTSGMLEQVIHQDLVYSGPLSSFSTPDLQYASHRHGSLDRAYEDVKGFVELARNLIGFGTNFGWIAYTQLDSMEVFQDQADHLAVSCNSRKKA
jgi:hypothetical protein